MSCRLHCHHWRRFEDLGLRPHEQVCEGSSTASRYKNRKAKRAMMLVRPGSAPKMEAMSTGMPGIRLRARSGRRARTDRIAVKLPNQGKRINSHARVTTAKSRMHQASRR